MGVRKCYHRKKVRKSHKTVRDLPIDTLITAHDKKEYDLILGKNKCKDLCEMEIHANVDMFITTSVLKNIVKNIRVIEKEYNCSCTLLNVNIIQ